MQNFYSHIKYLFSIYVLGIIFFTLIRLCLMFSQWDRVTELPDAFSLMINASVIGFRFDSVISGYILALPLVLLLLSSIIGFENRKLVRFCHIYLCTFYSIALFGCIANIPYFAEFYKHINASVFNWKDEKSFVFTMIMKENIYLMYFLASLIVPALFVYLATILYKRIYKHYKSHFHFPRKVSGFLHKILIFFILGGLCFLGIRGRISQKSPIRVGTAFFSTYMFPNQLALNPIYYFLNSLLETGKKSKQEVRLIPDDDALKLCRIFYHASDSLKSPVVRIVRPDGERKNYNVVVILMESMSADLMKRNGNPNNFTPFLDSLANQSTCFENCYSAGIHTMNGVFSTLFSYPALFTQHPMKTVDIANFQCLPSVLRKNNYQTAYFTTHDDQFDNIGGFLKINGIELIQAQRDYPLNKVKSNLGVPDDYMFERAIPVLTQLSDNGQPFFATMLTASNHAPYIIPDYFKPSMKDIKDQIIEYSDWSIRKFFEMARKEKWFDNTIFVLTGDHGLVTGSQPYEISVSRHHCPLIIYGKDIPERSIAETASQLDIFPTIMGILEIAYANNTFGFDLLKEKRKYALLNSDDIVACVDDSLMYIYSTHGKEALYRYKIKSTENILEKKQEKADEMRQFMFSTMQSAQYIIKNSLTTIQ